MTLSSINIICRLLVGLALIYHVCLYFQWTDTKEVRYRKYYRMMYDIIFNEVGPVTLAEIGSSRAQTMIGANELHKEIFGEESDIVVYNLATSQRGKGFHYVILRDIFSEREVSEVLLHFINTDSRSEYEVHPWFYIVAKNSDLYESMFLRKHVPWYRKVISGGRIFLKKHSSIIEDYMVGKLALATPKESKALAETRDHLTANAIRPNSLEKTMRKSIAEVLVEHEEWELSEPREHRNNFYTKKIVQMVKSNNAEINFFYIPRLMEPTLSQNTIAEIQETFDTQMLAPSADDLKRMYPDAYADAGHGSVRGRRIYAKIVANKLLLQNSN